MYKPKRSQTTVYIISHLSIFSSKTTGDQALHTGGEGLDESAAMDDEDIGTQPQGRRNRREACTCPFCKDGEGRYVTELLWMPSGQNVVK